METILHSKPSSLIYSIDNVSRQGPPYLVPEKDVTIEDIAKKVGVSVSSVSRVLTGVTGKRARKREEILQSAQDLGYQPNQIARNLVSKKTSLVGFVASDLSNAAYVDYYHLIGSMLKERGYDMLISDSERDFLKEQRAINRMLRNRVVGLFVFPVSDWDRRLESQCAKLYDSLAIPALVLGKVSGHSKPSVFSNDAHGAKLAVEALFKLGHRKAAFLLTAPKENPVARLRCKAFEKAFAAKTGNKVVILSCQEDLESIDRSALDARQAGVTAVLADCETAAALFLRSARNAGIRIPEDLSLISWGDSDICELTHPEISAIRIRHNRTAEVSANLFLDLLDEKSPSKTIRKKIDCRYIERQSVARP